MIKVISFDMDGTLVDYTFDKMVWHEELPKLYAEKHGVDIEEAKTRVYAEYYKGKYLNPTDQWTNIEYWCNLFGIADWKKIVEDLKDHVPVYDDTLETLKSLKGYKMVIISSAHRNFLDTKLDASGLKDFFDVTYSSPDYGALKKNRSMFGKIIEELRIKPEEMLHIGDEYDCDYEIPLSLGIKAFFLDRENKMEGDHVVHSLSEFKEKVMELGGE